MKNYVLIFSLGFFSFLWGCLLLNVPVRSSITIDISGIDQCPKRIEACYLPNTILVHPKVVSGGEPVSEEAFHELQQLGFKTIISVDGAKPNIALAKKYGLRYIHLPHGYDGIPTARVQELAKAVREFEGPIYMHCHHGKHRSPAAASVACVASGLIDPKESLSILKLAGTSPNYRGLFEVVASTQLINPEELDALEVEYHASVQVAPLVESMVDIEKCFDRLQTIAKAGWRTPEQHPDLVPAHEALLLNEQYRELQRSEVIQEKSVEFQKILIEATHLSKLLEEQLRSEAGKASSIDAEIEFNRINQSLKANCQSCHQQFRDTLINLN